ncbi:hypothetical protein [Emticicia fontis]
MEKKKMNTDSRDKTEYRLPLWWEPFLLTKAPAMLSKYQLPK